MDYGNVKSHAGEYSRRRETKTGGRGEPIDYDRRLASIYLKSEFDLGVQRPTGTDVSCGYDSC